MMHCELDDVIGRIKDAQGVLGPITFKKADGLLMIDAYRTYSIVTRIIRDLGKLRMWLEEKTE
jgi:hypothetical protein